MIMENSKTPLYGVFLEKLEKAGISNESVQLLDAKYGSQISSGSYCPKYDSGWAYEGSLVDISLNKLARYAFKLNYLFPENIQADASSIIKVALLQHISQSIRLNKSTDEWRIKNLGELYTYADGIPAVGSGVHSVLMCNECGIQFTPVELEAMISIDRSNEDLQTKFHSTVLTNVIKAANIMVYSEGQKKASFQPKL